MTQRFQEEYRRYSARYVTIENEKRVEQDPKREGQHLVGVLTKVDEIKSGTLDPETLPETSDDEGSLEGFRTIYDDPWWLYVYLQPQSVTDLSAVKMEKRKITATRLFHESDHPKRKSLKTLLVREVSLDPQRG